MKNFLQDIKAKKGTTLEENKKNGKEAENYVSSLLLEALNARVSHVSRTDDDAKIDLITLFSHPWIENIVDPIATQVKSGDTFCSVNNGTLEVKKTQFSVLLNRNSWSLVCWTKVENSDAYWFLIKPNSKSIRVEYNSNHLINPLTKFHLIRIIYSLQKKDGGRGLIFKKHFSRPSYPIKDFRELRKVAKAKYSTLQHGNLENPVWGKIEFTRLGWRHITREERFAEFKVASFEVMQIVDKILCLAPDQHYTLKHRTEKISDQVYVENEYLLHYTKVKVHDLEKQRYFYTKVFVKLLEISSFKENWKEGASANNYSQRRVIFKSIYYKQSS